MATPPIQNWLGIYLHDGGLVSSNSIVTVILGDASNRNPWTDSHAAVP